MRARKMRSSKRALRAVIARIREMTARGDFEPGQREEAIRHVRSLWSATRAQDLRRAEIAVVGLVRAFLHDRDD